MPRCVVVFLVTALTSACGSATSSPPPPAPRDVSLPDLSRMDPPVQAQVRQRYATLVEKRKAGASGDELGTAYGEYAMLLQAAEHHDAAAPAYLNAQDLMPGDVRWPYYLGHLYKSVGQPDKAIQSFTRALDLGPSEIATLIWLGRLYLEEGKPEAAEPLFTRAAALPPRNVAVLSGLGQAALARRDYQRAVSVLEEALTLDPSAASIRSPLANAYRGLGDAAKAEAHLKEWRNTDILVPDRLRMELDLALESGLSYELRGVRALESQDFTAAADFFRKGVEMTPGTTALGRSLRHKLGTALYLSGDVRAAVKWFEETIRMARDTGVDETAAKAHYSLGVLMASSGRGGDAIRHLSAAVRFSPNYVEAYQALADAERRAGRTEQSMSRYGEALRINPQAADARFGYGMALVRLGRYREARDWFAGAMRRHPDRQDFPHALARLLATAPDDGVRDGVRAQALVEQLLKSAQTTELGETMAMTLAELGQFDQAVAVQRGVIEASRRAGSDTEATRMAVNLQRYERQQPCRVPWPNDDPVHSPGPPVNPGLLTASAPPRQ